MGSGEQPEPRQCLPTPSQADCALYTQTGLSLLESRAWHYWQAGRREDTVRTFPPSVLRIPCHKEMEIRRIWDTDRLLHRLNIVLCSHKHQEKKCCNIFSSKIITLCIYFYITTIYKKPLPESELWGHNLQKTLQHLSERLEVLLNKKIHIFPAKFSVFHVLHSYLLRHNHTCLWLIRIQPLDQVEN